MVKTSSYSSSLILTDYDKSETVQREIIIAYPDITNNLECNVGKQYIITNIFLNLIITIAVHINGGILDSSAINNGDLTMVVYQQTQSQMENKKLEIELFFDDQCSGISLY